MITKEQFQLSLAALDRRLNFGRQNGIPDTATDRGDGVYRVHESAEDAYLAKFGNGTVGDGYRSGQFEKSN